MKRRADWRMTLYCKQTADRTKAIDITGWTATMQVKSGPNGEVYKDLNTPTNVVITAAEGKIMFKISKEEIANLDFAHAIYEVLIVDSSATTTCPLIGDVEMLS
jgi:hypothetical protein